MQGGCSSAGRAGRLVIGRSLVQIPAPGKAELHVEVSLSKILNPTLLISEDPVMSWRPGSTLPWDKAGIGSSSNTLRPLGKGEADNDMTEF